MKKQNGAWILIFAIGSVVPTARAQKDAPQSQTGQHARTSTNSNAQNIQEYTDLLRSDVRQRKAEIMGSMMQLSASDAAKFWPIYDEYDKKLTKLNDLRVANIQEYASSYNRMTDAKADELVHKAFEYHKQRSELLASYYERVKQQLGATTAARFIQIEDQLLLLIDLQIDSSLPVVGQSS